ncbi:hypothetical protein EHS25_004744 [Saitozyma podzolica]|uniref:FAD/NAD(P)-binding domain-containing protein n=1 Tax=Saitozyma podzolica TaxID=1890683 RepID=A0A427Y2K1_9TREE|nr:hypothetical protein EHS25_004744 [Saitozyma podzolica]
MSLEWLVIKKVKTTSGKTVEADYVFVSVGNNPNSEIVAKADLTAVREGLVVVDEFLRVRSDKLKKYYAIGDVSNIPGIIADVKGQATKKYVRPVPHGTMIPLGTKDARGHLTLPLVGTWMVPRGMVKAIKGTKLFVEDVWLPRFKDVRFKGSLCRVLLNNVDALRARLQASPTL